MNLGVVGEPADCIVGGLDANGNTVVSCGWDGTPVTTGQMIPNAPTCQSGDQLSFQGGYWTCVPAPHSGVSSAVVYGALALAVVAVIAAKR